MAALLNRLKSIVRRILRREPPHDPYAYMMASRKPRPAGRSGAAALDEPTE